MTDTKTQNQTQTVNRIDEQTDDGIGSGGSDASVSDESEVEQPQRYCSNRNDQYTDRDTVAVDDFHKEFTIEVGTTLVTDELSGTQHAMWRATVTATDASRHSEDATNIGKHPADAILGAVEEATDGVIYE